MNEAAIKDLLTSVQQGVSSIGEALEKLKHLSFIELDYAKIDVHREIRTGFPEVIFCEGKTSGQVLGIVDKMMERQINILGSRCGQDIYQAVSSKYKQCRYNQTARTFSIENITIKQ